MTILAILNRAETADAVLRAAAELQEVYGNIPVSGMRPRPDVEPDFMPTEEVMLPDRSARFEESEDKLTEALRRAAKTVLPYDEMIVHRGTVRAVVAQAATEATVVVAGTAGHAGWSLPRDAIEAVLFDAAAPLLLVPNGAPSLKHRVVALAWERSPAAEDEAHAALPMLEAAEHVIILEAEEGHDRASQPEQLMAALERLGRPVRLGRFALGGRDVGTAILDKAAASSAEVLVMGAFTHWRLFERLFGGATQAVLEGARIPLFLHH